MNSTNLVENKLEENGTATFELGINVQMYAGLYVEPIQGVESTYEDEHKKFTMNADEYGRIKSTLDHKSKELQRDVFTCIGYEASGLTYKEVTLSMRREDPADVHDRKYTASEDLAFLYSALAEISDCIFELECVFEA